MSDPLDDPDLAAIQASIDRIATARRAERRAVAADSLAALAARLEGLANAARALDEAQAARVARIDALEQALRDVLTVVRALVASGTGPEGRALAHIDRIARAALDGAPLPHPDRKDTPDHG